VGVCDALGSDVGTIFTGTVMVKGSDATTLAESVTCTVKCAVLAVVGTWVAESTPLVNVNHGGRVELFARVHVNGATPVPALVSRVRLKLPPMLAIRLAAVGATMATCGLMVIVSGWLVPAFAGFAE